MSSILKQDPHHTVTGTSIAQTSPHQVASYLGASVIVLEAARDTCPHLRQRPSRICDGTRASKYSLHVGPAGGALGLRTAVPQAHSCHTGCPGL